MLPQWFTKWNSDNPKDIYGPAILVGTLGGAVAVAALLVTWGQPLATDSQQTGPRGTGMSVPEFDRDRLTPDPDIAKIITSEPILPQPGDATAGQFYDNIDPLLADLTVANYDRLVAAMQSWTGIPGLLTDDAADYQNTVAYQMIQMTQSINENWAGHVNANGVVGVTCYTCHRGEPVPSEIWFRLGPVTEGTEGWSSNQNRVTVQSQFTSLPSDALEVYLLDYGRIGVHDLEAHVAAYPSEEGYPTWQDTERTFSLMNYMSNSLGVNCVFCHNSRAFYDTEQATPQWNTAMLGISMVQELNNDWLVPLEDVYPPERLGPVFADAPKAACKTCHKGYQQPLQGTNMISNWPELASTDGPFYD